MGLVAEVIGDLTFQSGFQDPLGQLREQTILPGQLQPVRPCPAGELGDQLLIDRVQPGWACTLGRAVGYRVEVNHRLVCQVCHRVHTP
ncbi:MULTISPECIES: hypothetical protein [unclassified Pseudonocardia]|uniref:hypothetical protein n=1 Tax=Pseudonocardia sp. Ae707_Ps1 TaxID=1885572 RepID=UPI001BAFF95C|nr:hypothetical protein [Pseudonocardia sp. Ae707_Ps1]